MLVHLFLNYLIFRQMICYKRLDHLKFNMASLESLDDIKY